MARQINDTQPYSDKLVKLIPSEIVGAYMVLSGILGYAPGNDVSIPASLKQMPDSELKPILLQIVFFVLLILTPGYLKKISKVDNIKQLLITAVSFIIWVYTLGGPFVIWNIYYSLFASIVLVLWTLIIPLFISSAPEP